MSLIIEVNLKVVPDTQNISIDTVKRTVEASVPKLSIGVSPLRVYIETLWMGQGRVFTFNLVQDLNNRG